MTLRAEIKTALFQLRDGHGWPRRSTPIDMEKREGRPRQGRRCWPSLAFGHEETRRPASDSVFFFFEPRRGGEEVDSQDTRAASGGERLPESTGNSGS